jgi:hypothetical protein
VVAALALLVACEHSTPFRPGDYPPGDAPRDASGRLTYNPGSDRAPAWLPDGSGLLYARERLDREDRDRCLSELPPTGGSVRREVCGAEPGDSTDAFDSPAPAADGRLAHLWASSPADLPSIEPRSQRLGVRRADDRAAFRTLATLPYFFDPAQQPHESLSQVRWAGDSTLVYLGERVAYTRECTGCPLDTLRWGADVVVLTWSGPSVALAAIPNGNGASSAAVSGGGDTVYYTRNGETAVYRYARLSGETATVHDFATGIARDVSVAAGRLVAVVGGRVQYEVDPVLGAVQRDAGGELYLLDLASGGDQPLAAGARFYRRPALSPDGSRVAVEGYAYTIVGVDTIVGRVPDVWLVTVP